MKTWKVAIIGCGHIVEAGHARAWHRLAGRVEVVALCDASPAQLERVGAELGVPERARYTDYQDLLRGEQVDLVDIAVPHAFHEPVALAAARAGVHVLSEKPLAPTVQAASRMIVACEDAGVRLGVIHNYRYLRHYALATKLIRSGAIGEPFLIRTEAPSVSHWPGTQHFDPDWRTRAAISGGGALLDNGYHNLYLAEEWMGSPITSVSARIATYTRPIDVEDTAVLLLGHASGGTTSLQVSWGLATPGRYVEEIHGRDGAIAFRRDDQPLGLFRQGKWAYPAVEPGDDFALAFADFLWALESGAPLPVDGRAGLANLQVIHAAYRAAAHGQTEHLEPHRPPDPQ